MMGGGQDSVTTTSNEQPRTTNITYDHNKPVFQNPRANTNIPHIILKVSLVSTTFVI